VTREIPKITSDTPERYFSLRSRMHNFYINDAQYEHGQINFRVTTKVGAPEVWVFKNTDRSYPHPMHIHGVEFYILSINGKEPPIELRNIPKDTVLVNPQDEIKILVIYRGEGAFPYHCHILEHEEQGMMGMMDVVLE
ncbi:MAG: multicopper oxidase domain-containing protein, partial [Brevinema sp.]